MFDDATTASLEGHLTDDLCGEDGMLPDGGRRLEEEEEEEARRRTLEREVNDTFIVYTDDEDDDVTPRNHDAASSISASMPHTPNGSSTPQLFLANGYLPHEAQEHPPLPPPPSLIPPTFSAIPPPKPPHIFPQPPGFPSLPGGQDYFVSNHVPNYSDVSYYLNEDEAAAFQRALTAGRLPFPSADGRVVSAPPVEPHYPEDENLVIPTKQLTASATLKRRQLPEEVIEDLNNHSRFRQASGELNGSGGDGGGGGVGMRNGGGAGGRGGGLEEEEEEDDDDTLRRRRSRIVTREPEDELGRECILPLRHVEEKEEEEEGEIPEEIASTKPEDILHMIKL